MVCVQPNHVFELPGVLSGLHPSALGYRVYGTALATQMFERIPASNEKVDPCTTIGWNELEGPIVQRMSSRTIVAPQQAERIFW